MAWLQRLRGRNPAPSVWSRSGWSSRELAERELRTVPGGFERAADELLLRGAARLPHGRWSLYRHLLGTYDILRAWEQPEYVCLAGFCHSAYSTDVFAPRLFGIDERARVRELIGVTAERVAYLFCALARENVFAATRARACERDGTVEIADRFNAAPIAVSGAELGDLVTVHIANLADQAVFADGSPRPWLAEASSIARDAAYLFDRAPPVLGKCTADVRPDAERALLAAYAPAWDARSQAAGADDVLADAARAVPWVGEPQIVLGFRALQRDAADEVAHRGQAAYGSFCSWGTAWDKRLAFAHWYELAKFLVMFNTLPQAERSFLARRIGAILDTGPLPERLYAQLSSMEVLRGNSASTRAPIELPDRFAQYAAGFRDNRERPAMLRYPGLPSRPWHDPSEFPLARALEANAPEIIAEIRALDAARFHAEAEKIPRTGAWNVFILFERGRRRDENCALLPATTAILERHRIVRSLAGLAYVSRLAPGTHVAPHAGPTNMRLRCHLGVSIPPRCGLTVDGVSRTWREGECLVFDDSLTHSAWNDGDRDRLVLIVDLWHPDLSDDEVRLLEGLHRYTAGHAANLAAYWRKNEAARLDG